MSACAIRLGVSPLSWMNDDLPLLGRETSLSTMLEQARTIGYRGVELGRRFPRDPDALAELLARHELALVSGWYGGLLAQRGAQEEIDAVGPHLELLARNGAGVMVYGEAAGSIQAAAAPLWQRPRLVGDDRMEAYGRRLETFAQYALSQGVHVAYHHHMGTCVETPADVERLMACTGPALGLTFDTGHMHFGGGDPVAELTRHIGRVRHVHCKDVRPPMLALARNRGWSFTQAVINGAFTVPGDGALDFPAIIGVLRRHAYTGWCVVEAEQDPAVAPAAAYAGKGYRTLRALLDGPAAAGREVAA